MAKAGDIGWAILKDMQNRRENDPYLTPDREFGEPYESDFTERRPFQMDSPPSPPFEEQRDRDFSSHHEDHIAELFLQTLRGFLEEGQEDYIMAEMENEGYNRVHPSEIESGRRLALRKLDAMLMSSKFPPA